MDWRLNGLGSHDVKVGRQWHGCSSRPLLGQEAAGYFISRFNGVGCPRLARNHQDWGGHVFIWHFLISVVAPIAIPRGLPAITTRECLAWLASWFCHRTSASPHVNKEVQLQIEYSYVNSDGTYTGVKTSSGRISLDDDEELTTYSVTVPTDTTYLEVTDIYVTPTDVAEELDEYKIIYANTYGSTTIGYDYDGDHDMDYYDDDQLIYYNIVISGFSTFDDDAVTVSLFTTDGQVGKSKRVNITGNGTYSGWFGVADDEYDSYCSSNGSYALGFNLTELEYSGTARIYDETNDDPASIDHTIQGAYYMTSPSGGTLVSLYCVYDTYNYDWMD